MEKVKMVFRGIWVLCRYIPERLLHARGTPRCLFMVVVSIVSACVVCFNAFASLPMLFPAAILAGTAFGAHWSLMATLTSEFFGLHHFASNYTFIQVRPRLPWAPSVDGVCLACLALF